MPANRDKLDPKTPPPSVSVQIAAPENHLADDDYTGQHRAMPEAVNREQLRELRRSRTPSERMDRLEDKHDALVDDVSEIKVSIASIDTSLSIMVKRDERDAAAQADIETAKAKAEIAKKTAIDVAEAKGEIKDKLDARGARRKLWLKIVGGALGAVAVVVVHKLVQLWLGWL